MCAMDNNCEIAYYANVKSQKVDWLWYPYIPYGKITLIQGDPGEGKTSFILKIASLLTNGQAMPFTTKQTPKTAVIYQNAEDSVADTIKPRLEKYGADCNQIAFISTEKEQLSFVDTRFREAICETGAKLLILDPLQAFVPTGFDMLRATDMRTTMGKLATLAEETKCAIVLIGHLNKANSAKGLYRSIGSIDIPAIARSVLVVGRQNEEDKQRVVVHLKSNLAPTGESFGFVFTQNGDIEWNVLDELVLPHEITCDEVEYLNKQGQAGEFLIYLLHDGKPIKARQILNACEKKGIAERTINRAKKKLPIKSIRIDNEWYWQMEGNITGETEDTNGIIE